MSFDGEALRTERLVMRRWRPEDEASMVTINSDPTVTEFLGRRIDAAATAAFLDRTRAHWAEHGFGHWAVEPTEGPLAGDTIGFVGIAFPTFLPKLATRPELGWRLASGSSPRTRSPVARSRSRGSTAPSMSGRPRHPKFPAISANPASAGG